ncbi:hypothetical protein CC80DRAFT_308779 [Byssothecium circinans]|uniref:Uncharacterized protein n=1 Tax=Byssothecium circinans TaxID=147558 RepID=A0A6A5U4A3_9PLEO|nr:hypothetical protein CC80DRAFT_308779 [Byssothecium circinans]
MPSSSQACLPPIWRDLYRPSSQSPNPLLFYQAFPRVPPPAATRPACRSRSSHGLEFDTSFDSRVGCVSPGLFIHHPKTLQSTSAFCPSCYPHCQQAHLQPHPSNPVSNPTKQSEGSGPTYTNSFPVRARVIVLGTAIQDIRPQERPCVQRFRMWP